MYSQIQINIQNVVQPSCIRSIGHNYNEEGDGSILVSVTNGVPPYTFSIGGLGTTVYFSEQNNNYFPGLNAGLYYINVIDAIGQYGQSGSVLLTATKSTPIITSIIEDSVSSCNGNDGSIQLTAQKGTPPYWYSIDGGATYNTTGIFNNLTEGTYSLLVKDANSCITSIFDYFDGGVAYPAFIYVPFLENACNHLTVFTDYSFTDSFPITSCNAEGAADIQVSYNKDTNGNFLGEVQNLKFSLDGINYFPPTFTNQNLSVYYEVKGLSAGLHYCYIKDTITNLVAVHTFSISQSCDVYIDVIQISASCGASDGGLTIRAKYGATPYTYSMDGINFQTDSTFSGLSSGTYSVSVKDANGNITSAKATVYNKCPKVFATVSNAVCISNGSIQVHGYLGTKPYQFSLDNINYQNDSLFSNLAKNTYTVYLKDAKGYIDSVTNIQVAEICLNVTATITNENCNQKNGSIVATGSNGTSPYLFAIDGVNFQSNNTFSNLDSGTYVLTIKDANNLTDTIHVKVLNIFPSPINLGNDTTLCTNQTLLLNPNVTGASYTWQDNSTNNTFQVNKAGKYWVQANANGCIVRDTINVSYLNLSNQIFPTHDTALCIGNSILLDAKNPGATYLWNNNAATQIQIINTSGKYWVQVNTSGCSASDTINLHFITGPTISLPNDTSFCTGYPITLTAGNNAAAYLWNNNSTSNNIVISNGGKYWVAATQYGCTNVDTVQVTQYPTPTVFLGNDTTLCAGQILLLSAPVSTPAYQYLWQDNSTANTYSLSNIGVYSVKITNQYNCSASDTINVKVRPLPVFSLGNDTTLCTAKTLQLNINLPKDKFLWSTGNTTSSITISNAGLYWSKVSDSGCVRTDSLNVSYKPNPQVFLGNDTTLCEGNNLLLNATNTNATYQWQDGTTQPTYNITGQGTYTVKVTGANGCDTTSKIVIDYITKPIINLGNDTTLCLSDKLILNAAYTNSNYLWQDNSIQPSYTVTQAGTYKVDVTNICGNTSDSIHIQYENCACEFYVPSAFTPNGDSKNDIFKPSYKCFFTNYTLRIFNRYGQIIFQSQDPSIGWDGTLNGQNIPVGTYVWIINFYDTYLKQNTTKQGTVVLVR